MTEKNENVEEKLEEKVEESPVEEEVELSAEEKLQAQVITLEEQVAILKNEYAKAYADAENMKKRLQTDFEQRTKFQMANFAKELLPILDNCERALAQETQDEAYRKGVEMIYSQLQNTLAKEGVQEIDALNHQFDGSFHQALMSEAKEGVEPNIVIEILQKGYMIKDRLLRPAMVKVSE
ncbi:MULTISPECIES: nucleotide exchange factor GrpE [Terrabacteria group]|uniref:nucleotide exchange factor GrpE n=1 Tax=Bacillati TaxID=1783272 RepID=UPI001C6E7AD1|nr:MULTISPECIES: nucleotide exchange factor GrpE [Terrabacteria group]MBW9211974.1 nucleotide exchange factor GrpE [Trueperella sp. zg.1013]